MIQTYSFHRLKEQLIHLVDTPAFVFVDTAKEAADQHLQELADFQGCSEEEIKLLEQRLSRSFPAALREFLAHFGKNMTSMPIDPYSCYLTLTTSQKLLSPYEMPNQRFTINPEEFNQQSNSWMEELPETFPIYPYKDQIIVFTADRTEIDNNSIYFYLLRCDEGDDPPVYRWNIYIGEEDTHHSLDRYNERLTDFITKNFNRIRDDYNFRLSEENLTVSIKEGRVQYRLIKNNGI